MHSKNFYDAGFILMDYQREFGLFNGEIVLGDEVFPESSRLCDIIRWIKWIKTAFVRVWVALSKPVRKSPNVSAWRWTNREIVYLAQWRPAVCLRLYAILVTISKHIGVITQQPKLVIYRAASRLRYQPIGIGCSIVRRTVGVYLLIGL